MSKPYSKPCTEYYLTDERYGECQCCGTPRILSSAGYCEPCLMLAHAAASDPAAKIALLLRATWR